MGDLWKIIENDTGVADGPIETIVVYVGGVEHRLSAYDASYPADDASAEVEAMADVISLVRSPPAITVVQTGWSGSIGGHSYYGLVIGQKGTSVISKPGDSGAPVYRSVGSSSAEIRGHHIGVPGNGTTQTFFMPFSMAESQTGSSVATTCCNGTSY